MMDFIIILTKSRVFFTKFTEYYTITKSSGFLVNLASTEYRSITEKFKGFFIKLMDFIIILTKSRVFFTKFTEYSTITKSSCFF